MAWMMSGTKAKRYVLVWRGAAGGLGLFAATLWAVQTPLVSPDVRISQALAPSGPANGPGTPDPAPTQVEPDTVQEVAARLYYVIGRQPKGAEEPPKAEDPGQPALAAWKYLGAIFEPNRKIAIVSVDGRQATLAEGRELNGRRLVEVKPDAIVLDDGTQRFEVPKEAKTGPSVAWVTPAGAGAGLGGGTASQAAMLRGVGANGVTNAAIPAQMDPSMPGFTPEEQAQMRERGIDPATAARMRQRLEKDRSTGRGNRAGTNTTTDDGRVITTTPKPSKDADGPAGDQKGPEAPTQ